MSNLNIADVLIIITIALSTIIGIYRGFIREILTMITWIVAGVVAYMYGKVVGEYFFFVENAAIKETLGMIAVFMAVVLLGFLIKLIIVKAGKFPGISTADRLTGGLFGALRGCIIIVLLLLLSSQNINNQDWYKKSQLLPKFARVSTLVTNATPKSWKSDVQNEVNAVMNVKQAPAAVTNAVPSTKPAPKPAETSTTEPAATKPVPTPATTTTAPSASTPESKN